MSSEQALGRRLIAGEGQPACLIDPDAKDDGAVAVDSVSGSRKARAAISGSGRRQKTIGATAGSNGTAIRPSLRR
jgi:hypothetical protein